ncbi:MAG: hypothetical protein WCM76_14900 [Bacteroidota bacterium]
MESDVLLLEELLELQENYFENLIDRGLACDDSSLNTKGIAVYKTVIKNMSRRLSRAPAHLNIVYD